MPKILGIGLSRTGTSSLKGALNLLGFPAVHYPRRFSQIEAHAAATDITVSLVFKKLDRLYPGSCFILTLRALEPWLESCERFWKKNAGSFASNPTVMRIEMEFYGGHGFDRQRFIEARERHLSAVEEHFRNRPRDLLHLDLFEDPAPWHSLCPFLQVPVPDRPFPHQNQAVAVDRILLRLLEALKDVARVAKITQISEDYLAKLSARRESLASGETIALEGGFDERFVLKRGCAALGAKRLAEILDLDPGELEAHITDRSGA